MKLAVTGGCGFLGMHICNELYDKYEQITAIDIANFNKEEYPEHVKYVKADVRDYKKMEEVLADHDHVIHAAAALPLWKDDDIITTTEDGTRNVIEACRKNGINRMVYISSTAVYTIPQPHPIYETSTMGGVGPYGTSKINAEMICKDYMEDGMVISICRPKTFIGTGRLGVFQILYDWVESGKKIPMIGSGNNKYQLLDVEDLVDSIYLMLTVDEDKARGIFNIGAKEFKTMKEDFGALCNHAGNGSRILQTLAWPTKLILDTLWKLKISPLYEWVYKTADQDSYVSIEKAEKYLGYKPKFSNKDTLIKSYEWYLANKESVKVGEGKTHKESWKQGIIGIVKIFM